MHACVRLWAHSQHETAVACQWTLNLWFTVSGTIACCAAPLHSYDAVIKAFGIRSVVVGDTRGAARKEEVATPASA